MAQEDGEAAQFDKQRVKVTNGVKLGIEIAIGFMIVGFVITLLITVLGIM